jgi:AraC family L-rhamnose operon transcriptional activator RhaR
MSSARQRAVAVCSLHRSALAEIRHNVAQLIHLGATTEDALHWDGAVVVLQTLLLLLRSSGWLATPLPASTASGSRGIQRLLAALPLDGSLVDVVSRSGYQRDHLNRLVKQDTGLSLGQFRAQQRLTKAKQLLLQGLSVAATATTVGLPDQGYFARWFRRQTGQPPSVWSRTQRRVKSADAQRGPLVAAELEGA